MQKNGRSNKIILKEWEKNNKNPMDVRSDVNMRRKSILCLILVMLLCSLINMQDVSAASKKKKVGFDKKV